MQQAEILVIGANGKTGRRVMQRLTERGHTVRAGSRQANPAFDWEQPSNWPEVLQGIKSVYISYYPDLAVASAPGAIEKLIACAKQVGVRQIVLLSGRGEVNAQRCEKLVSDSGLNFTLLRASWFAQNFSEGHLYPSVLQGVIALPAAEVREPFIDVDDIADVAVAALTDTQHNDQLYELTGPRLLSFAQAAAEISKASGRNVNYMPISSKEFHSGLKTELGVDFANLLTDLCKEVLDGRNASVTDGVQKALGRAPRDFADFCQATVATGVWN